MKIIFNLAIAMVVASNASAAFAGEDTSLRRGPEGVTATINFADLNITNPGDAKILLRRINISARKVCEHANPGLSRAATRDQRRCYLETYNDGITLINSRKSVDIEDVAARVATSREIVEVQ